MPNRAIICLGANSADAAAQLAGAFHAVNKLGEIVRSTPVYPSDPEYSYDAAPYLNRIVEIHTTATYLSALRITKDYESAVRKRAGVAPLVAVDIDIVVWNGATLRPDDAKAQYYLKGLAMLH